MHRVRLVVGALAALVAGCSSAQPAPNTGPEPTADGGYEYPAPPQVTGGPRADAADDAVTALVAGLSEDEFAETAVEDIAKSDDARLGWFLADLLRFIQRGPEQRQLLAAFEAVTGVDPSGDPAFITSPWRSVTNHLIAWDLPAHPGYRDDKARLFTLVEPGWRPFFDDAESDIDWRIVSWGGVLIDDRPPGDQQPCPPAASLHSTTPRSCPARPAPGIRTILWSSASRWAARRSRSRRT